MIEKDRKKTMAFDTEHQPKKEARKPRGKGKRVLMLDAIRDSVNGGEAEFLSKVVSIAIGNDEEKPNVQLLTLVLQRIEPPLKSTMPLIEFDFDEKLSPSKQAAQVLKAVSKGKVSPDVAHIFISSIASMMKIDEVTELQKRIEAIEKSLGLING